MRFDSDIAEEYAIAAKKATEIPQQALTKLSIHVSVCQTVDTCGEILQEGGEDYG
jgi:hypothetical protein